jgi:hypothetical protein
VRTRADAAGGDVAARPPARRVRLFETGVTARDTQRRATTSSTLRAGEFTLCGHSTAYGRHVSGVMENRAAVFTSQPQAVEVYQAGTWWAGELLGWRHDADGSCQVWVRVVLGGVEETAWTDLATLRLPERHLSVAAATPLRGPATQEMSVARHPSGRRARSGDADATASLPKVPGLSVVQDSPSTGGRRTAAETAQFASVGRRRAPDTGDIPVTGRRRAPESAESPSGGRRRAPEAAVATAVPGGAGRHRAPGAVDTGLVPAVSAVPRPAGAGWGPAPSQDGWTAPEGMEAELLTRPMRLSDHMQSRRPRLGGSLSL